RRPVGDCTLPTAAPPSSPSARPRSGGNRSRAGPSGSPTRSHRRNAWSPFSPAMAGFSVRRGGSTRGGRLRPRSARASTPSPRSRLSRPPLSRLSPPPPSRLSPPPPSRLSPPPPSRQSRPPPLRLSPRPPSRLSPTPPLRLNPPPSLRLSPPPSLSLGPPSSR